MYTHAQIVQACCSMNLYKSKLTQVICTHQHNTHVHNHDGADLEN